MCEPEFVKWDYRAPVVSDRRAPDLGERNRQGREEGEEEEEEGEEARHGESIWGLDLRIKRSDLLSFRVGLLWFY